MKISSIIKKIQRWHDVDGCDEYTVAISPLKNDKEYTSVKNKIISGLKIQEAIRERAKSPMAMNYAQFEIWINELIKDSKKKSRSEKEL